MRQEPVAWGVFEGNLHDMFFTQEEADNMAHLKGTHVVVRPLYTHPQEWVGLTAEEREQVQIESYGKVPHHVALIAAVEKLLKEKNCG